MRNHLILLIILLSSTTVGAQFVYKIKADSLLVTNDSCTAEFILENSTKNVKGFLVNKGNGRTEFRRASQLTDSSFIVGGDTIVIRGIPSGGGGGTPSWQQTLNVSRRSRSNIIFDTATGDPTPGHLVSKNFITVNAIDTTEDAAPFLMGTSANGGYGTNHILYMGWNLKPDGSVQNSGLPAIGEAWEQRDRPNSGSDNSGKHEIYVRPSGSTVKLSSYGINNNTGRIDLSHIANSLDVRASEVAGASNDPYFRVVGDAGSNSGSAFTLTTLTGSLVFNNEVSGTSANFSITANYPGSNNYVSYQNFASASMPHSITLKADPSVNSSSITMSDTNSLFNTVLSSYADYFLINQRSTGDFRYSNANGIKLRIYDTKSYFQNPIRIGQDNDPVGALDARTSTLNYGVHGVTTSTDEGYGVSGRAFGSGAIFNVGGLFTASDGQTNMGIWVTNINAGTNNYNYYAEGTAKSYFNGPIGIKENTPTAYLHLASGTSSANTAPLKFTSGTNLSTPENGTVEYNGTNYFVTSGNTRYTLAKTLSADATLDFGNTSAGAKTDLTITVAGAESGDVVAVGVPSGSVVGNGSFTAWVSSTNTVTVRFTNNDLTTAYNPSSGLFRVSVITY